MKREILRKLKDNYSDYVSGEYLSNILGVSRTAVWKSIKELKEEGYVIESSSRKGYKLSRVVDIINAFEINEDLKTKVLGRDIVYFDHIDSTNNYAKRIAQEGCEEGTLVIADYQSSGRGRLGRVWNSCDKKGVWMSLVLRPRISLEEVQIITLAASIAIVRTLKGVVGIDTGIKWPNDIILDNKKVCGILIEMSLEMERINFLVLGIGINVNQHKDDFPEELRNKATSLRAYLEEKASSGNINLTRSEIISTILLKFEEIYDKVNSGAFEEVISEWKKYSVTLGKEVSITYQDKEYVGVAENITSDGRLIVRCKDGTLKEVLSGEVSVRGLLGYV